MKQKIIGIVLTLCMVVSVTPMVSAQETPEDHSNATVVSENNDGKSSKASVTTKTVYVRRTFSNLFGSKVIHDANTKWSYYGGTNLASSPKSVVTNGSATSPNKISGKTAKWNHYISMNYSAQSYSKINFTWFGLNRSSQITTNVFAGGSFNYKTH